MLHGVACAVGCCVACGVAWGVAHLTAYDRSRLDLWFSSLALKNYATPSVLVILPVKAALAVPKKVVRC